ncbi:MAG: 2-dehydro-3-deoxygalactonokinase [Pseudomonadota bacterium]|nr:2-dehydro-3-deoxygalactonokinase [Pseudomonadota bacterium]
MVADPAFIGVDWGTSAFRAYLADGDGRALDSRAGGEGALGLKAGEHEPYLAGRLASWPRLPVIACGMVGAKQGWREAPYVACPAGLAEIARAMLTLPTAFGPVRIAPGVRALDGAGAPDVMRGEETQILGALAAGFGDGAYVLPGTHSKWARVEGGRIVGFETFMTGEVFAVLKTHSVLGRMMAPERQGEGFARGVEAARRLERPGDLLHAIFAARTFGLFETLPPDQLGEFLSGLLIGAEILAGARGATRATAIGSPALTERYIAAGAALGVALTPAPENCALLGLRALWAGGD